MKIRLKRMGRKKLPVYKIVVCDGRSKRDGKIIEMLGTYNPKSKELNINIERVKAWISKGAQPTDRVSAILKLAVH